MAERLAADPSSVGAAPDDFAAPDFGAPAFYLGDPEAAYRRLRRDAPVYRWEPRPGFPIWILTRWSDIREVSKRPKRFCSSRGIRLVDMLRQARGEVGALGNQLGTIVHMDPPRHGEVRSLLNKVFTPRRVSELEPWMRSLIRERLDRLPASEPIDLVNEIAAPVPAIAIARILGVPEGGWRDFQASADALIHLDAGDLEGEEAARAMAQAGRFFRQVRGWVEERRTAPGDDLLSALVGVEEDGVRFDASDAATMAVTLLVAGNETTRTLISGACLALIHHPAEREALIAEPGLLPGAIEEFLRWVTPVHSHARMATEDAEVRGVVIRKGEALVLMYRSANRDEEVWPDADVLDVSRPVSSNPHLSFGHGEHFCLGASLARLEAQVVCEELLARYPRFALAGEPERQRSTHFNGIVSMPVVLGGAT
jgi:cytochrome P450